MTELEKAHRLVGDMLKAQHEQERKAVLIDGQVTALGEALFMLSGPLRASGFLNDASNHAAYEKVVAAFQAIGKCDHG